MTLDTGKARLPGLVVPHADDPDLARWIQAVSERLEVREGARGNPYERALTVRDLARGGIVGSGGLGGIGGGGSGGGGSGGGGSGGGGSGGGGSGGGSSGDGGDYTDFWNSIRGSDFFATLLERISGQALFDDINALLAGLANEVKTLLQDDLAAEVRAVMSVDLAEEARKRGADIRKLETRIQTDTRSLSMSVQEITAALDGASAGVREVIFSQAETDKAIAGKITQLVAKVDTSVAGINEVLLVLAEADKALATKITDVKAQVDDNFASVQDSLTALATADAALAARVSSVKAEIDGKLASVQDSLTALANADMALAARVSSVKAEVDDSIASIQDGMVALATADAAIASRITQVKAEIDGKMAAVQQSATATADAYKGLSAEYYVKVQAGGAFGGFGLSAVAPADPAKPPYSQFLIAADKFALVSPDGRLNPFGVDVAGGYLYLNGQVRINANGGRAEDLGNEVAIIATGQVFNVNKDGATTPSSVTLTAYLYGALVGGTVTWATTPPGLGTISGNVITLPASALSGRSSVGVRASRLHNGVTYYDDFTAYKVTDGSDALTGLLTNEAHTLPATSAGVVTDYYGASGTFMVYKGATRLTTGVTYSVASAGGVTASISAGGAYAVTAGVTTDAVAVTLRATIGTTVIDKVFSLTRVKAGAAGTPGVGVPGVRGSLTGYSKMAGVWLTGANWAASATNDEAASKVIWFMLNNNLAMTAGLRSHLRIGDTVTLTNSTETTCDTRYWTGGGWAKPGLILDGNMLVKGSVSTDKLFALTIDASQIVSGSIDTNRLKAITIDASQIVSGSITTERLKTAQFDAAQITTGFLDAARLRAITIDASQIVSGTISTARLTAMQITADNITAGVSSVKNGMSFGFGTGGGVFGFSGAGFFRSHASDKYGAAVVNTGGGNALAVSATSASGGESAAVFNRGAADGATNWQLAVKLCSIDDWHGRQPTAGVFMHTNRNCAYLARTDQAGYFQSSAGASVSLGQGSNALSAYGNVTLQGGFANVGNATLQGEFANLGGGTYTTMGKNHSDAFGNWSVRGLYTDGKLYAVQELATSGSVYAADSVFAINGNVVSRGAVLTFTGAHYALLAKGVMPEPGDVLVDVKVVAASSVSDVVTEVALSHRRGQRAALGVFSGETDDVPFAISLNAATPSRVVSPKHAHWLATHRAITVNGVGEGLINVCAQGGDIEPGDLLECSDVAGKGTRQCDDVVRCTTVAKARVAVRFTRPDEVQQVACIYLCG